MNYPVCGVRSCTKVAEILISVEFHGIQGTYCACRCMKSRCSLSCCVRCKLDTEKPLVDWQIDALLEAGFAPLHWRLSGQCVVEAQADSAMVLRGAIALQKTVIHRDGLIQPIFCSVW